MACNYEKAVQRVAAELLQMVGNRLISDDARQLLLAAMGETEFLYHAPVAGEKLGDMIREQHKRAVEAGRSLYVHWNGSILFITPALTLGENVKRCEEQVAQYVPTT